MRDEESRKFVFIFLVILSILVASIALAFYLKNTDSNKTDVKVNIPKSTNDQILKNKNIKLSFENTQLNLREDTLKVRILFDNGNDLRDKVTGGMVILSYPKDVLEVETLTTQTVQPKECSGLNSVLATVDDNTKGILKFGKVTTSIDKTSYPSGKFCFGEVTFKVKNRENLSNANIKLGLNDKDFEVVGTNDTGVIEYEGEFGEPSQLRITND